MMINAQISIQIISATGPPFLIALKDVRNFEMQAEEPCFVFFLFVQKMCSSSSSSLPPTLSSTSVLFPPHRQNPQKHLLSRSKCQLIISPKHVFN